MSVEEYEAWIWENHGVFKKLDDGNYTVSKNGSTVSITPLTPLTQDNKEMKTVKDVVAEYHDGWPDNDYNAMWYHQDNSITFGNVAKPKATCTREEYEQELLKSKQTLQYDDNGMITGANLTEPTTPVFTADKIKGINMTKSNEWYDYDKQEAISLPPVGVECEVFNIDLGKTAEWERCDILFMGTFKCIYTTYSCVERIGDVDTIGAVKFRPLDYDKNKQRDEFIDECVRVTTLSYGQAVIAFGDLYDAGARFK